MQSTWNFIKNNRKTIMFATAAVAGFIGLRRYLSNMEKQWEHSQSRNFVAEVRKKGTYFDESICIGNDMANKRFPFIIKKLTELFNIVEMLKNIQNARDNNISPSEQLKFWEELKIEIFTYIVSEIYSISFLLAYLRVQLSIISGVMYFENQINSSSINSKDSAALLKDTTSRYYLFMSLLENFHLKGISNLVDFVRKHIRNTFQTKVTDNVTLKDMLKNLTDIKTIIRQSHGELIEENVLLVYNVNHKHYQDGLSENTDNITNELKACSKFVAEMIDIVKLPDFKTVIENCIDIGFSNLFDFIHECFIQFEKQNFTATTCNAVDSIEKRQFVNPYQINVLLIKILPLIWTQIHNSLSENNFPMKLNNNEFTEKQNTNRNATLVQYLLYSDSLTCFSANIYEAFCNEK